MVRSRIESSDLAPRSRGCRGLLRVRRHDRDGSRVFVASVELLVPFGRVGRGDAIEETWRRGAARRWMKRSPLASHAFFERESGNDLLSQPGTTAPHFIRKPDARQHAIFGRGHHQTQQQVRLTDHRRAEAPDRGSGLHGVQRHRSQRRSRTSWCADARLETRHVWEAGCGRGGDARGAACCVGYPAQGVGLGGQERNGISDHASLRAAAVDDENWVPHGVGGYGVRCGLGFSGCGCGRRGRRCTVVAAGRLSSLSALGPFEAVFQSRCWGSPGG